MAELLRPDICVIGAGSGGLTVAAAAAGFGVPVVLIEKGKMGGDCLNTGCVPSKALIAAAKHSDAFAQAKSFRILAGGLSVDFPAVHKHVTAVIAAIEPNDSKERFTGMRGRWSSTMQLRSGCAVSLLRRVHRLNYRPSLD
jgi:pyruvate/2-oxoglutarate dehydrogenase complex dihydrolipoamide dehydrogenase (E3) component